MQAAKTMLSILALGATLMCGCGGGGSSSGGGGTPPPQTAATPTFTTTNAQNGAQVVAIADSTPSSTIYYTLDGSTPTTTSMVYIAPILISSNVTVNAIATASGFSNSTAGTKAFTPGIASGTLVWSDEFNGNSTATPALPDANTWAYDTGFQCCGNNEQETYCAAGSTTSPCDTANPNAYVANDSYLHIVARQPSAGVYTSARLKTQGKLSFMYGRVEARLKLPESQGMWPAFWFLGNNIATVNWPACGEIDVMEHIDGAKPPAYAGGPSLGYDWIAGSLHGGTSSNELSESTTVHPSTFSAAAWHTYGMIWKKGEIDMYVDDPANVYATYKSTDAKWGSNGWPFDGGPQFMILNLAVGGSWPGNVDSTTVLPADMQVDYVRIYTN